MEIEEKSRACLFCIRETYLASKCNKKNVIMRADKNGRDKELSNSIAEMGIKLGSIDKQNPELWIARVKVE